MVKPIEVPKKIGEEGTRAVIDGLAIWKMFDLHPKVREKFKGAAEVASLLWGGATMLIMVDMGLRIKKIGERLR